jgi:hypothetical protein
MVKTSQDFVDTQVLLRPGYQSRFHQLALAEGMLRHPMMVRHVPHHGFELPRHPTIATPLLEAPQKLEIRSRERSHCNQTAPIHHRSRVHQGGDEDFDTNPQP